MLRSLGWHVIDAPAADRNVAAVKSSRPAIMRSKVDLPQPEGPSNTTNSPSVMPISTSCSTWVDPKNLSTLRMSTSAMTLPPVP